jgi:hypothetical protein
MSTHTPGPWFAQRAIGTDDMDCGWHIEPEMVDYKYRGMVASVGDAEHIGGITHDERDANARLIAAAPDLLDALTRLVDRALAYLDGYVMSGQITRADVEIARAACAKAKGEA